MELVAYDTVCMVLLDRPGNYYKIDQLARRNRGAFTPERVVASLRSYYSVIRREQLEHGECDFQMTQREVRDWWAMTKTTRAEVDAALQEAASATDAPFTPYDFAVSGFLRSFSPQQKDSNTLWRFYSALAIYMPLWLSPDVEIRRVPSLPGHLSYGVFAKHKLRSESDRRVNVTVPAIRGQLVRLSAEEEQALRDYGSDHSLLHVRRDVQRTRVPLAVVDPNRARDLRVTGRKRKRSVAPVVSSSSPSPERQRQECCFVVVGAISFINHACPWHANVHPCVWRGDDAVGDAQWQVVSLKEEVSVEAEQELWLDYTAAAEDEPDGRLVCPKCEPLNDYERLFVHKARDMDKTDVLFMLVD
jgi:hypothetical protein